MTDTAPWYRNDWIFSKSRANDAFMYLANTQATLESEAAERLVVEQYRSRPRRRPPITEWSDLADPWYPAALADWSPVRSVQCSMGMGENPKNRTPAILARAALSKRVARAVHAQGAGICVNCGYEQAGEHSFAEIGSCTLTLRRVGVGGAEPS